jgi:glutamyl-tRNA reductase
VEEHLKANEKNEAEEGRINNIIGHLRKKILHPLKKHMHDLSSEENKEQKIRVYSAVAIAKVRISQLFNILVDLSIPF